MKDVRLKTDDPLEALCSVISLLRHHGFWHLDREHRKHKKNGTWFTPDEARLWRALNDIHSYIWSNYIEVYDKEPAPQCPSLRTP